MFSQADKQPSRVRIPYETVKELYFYRVGWVER